MNEKEVMQQGAPSIEAARAMGKTGGPAVEAERLAFEAWMTGHCWALCATWDGETYRGSAESTGYIDPRAMNTRQLWAAWRDRAALTQPDDDDLGLMASLQDILDGTDTGEGVSTELLEGLRRRVLELMRPDDKAQPVAREGWKLVPVDPTADMLYEIQENCHILPPRGRRIWAQLLEAAPQPPAEHGLELQAEYERGRKAGITQVYDAMLNSEHGAELSDAAARAGGDYWQDTPSNIRNEIIAAVIAADRAARGARP